MKLMEKGIALLTLCMLVMMITGTAADLDRAMHDLFFDERFGLLNSFFLRDFITPTAVIFVALGWLNGMLIPIRQPGAAFPIKRLVIVILPLIFLGIVLFSFHMYFMQSYRDPIYSALDRFGLSCVQFYVAGFFLGMVSVAQKKSSGLDQRLSLPF